MVATAGLGDLGGIADSLRDRFFVRDEMVAGTAVLCFGDRVIRSRTGESSFSEEKGAQCRWLAVKRGQSKHWMGIVARSNPGQLPDIIA